jgi:hypothetical protein
MPEIPGRLRPPRLPVPPATPAGGEDYYDTVTHARFYWNDTEWVWQGQGPQGPPGPAGPPAADVSDVEHLVNDKDPGNPPTEPVYVSGDMQDPDAWPFSVTTLGWCSEASIDGSGLRVFQCPDPADPTPHNTGDLFSAAIFEALPGDTLSVTIKAFYQADTPTMQGEVCYGPDLDIPPEPGTGTQVVLLGTPVTLTSAHTPTAPATFTFTWQVPATITTVNDGTVTPEVARIGLHVTGTGTADMVFASTTLTRAAATWPLGSLWLNPAAGDALPTVGVTAPSATTGGNFGTATTWARLPVGKKAFVTAPPNCGGVVLVTSTLSVTGSNTNNVVLELSHFVDTGSGGVACGQMARHNAVSQPNTWQVPVTVMGNALLAPGQTVEIWLAYQYGSAPGATTNAARAHTMTVMFLPLGVMAGDPGQPALQSFWDGQQWREGTLVPAAMDLSQDNNVVPPSKLPTTTTITVPAGPFRVGDVIALQGNTTPLAADGTITFHRATSSSGPWTSLGAVTIDASNNATKNWTAVAGTWYFRAVYNGSATYATSSATSGARNVTSPTVTKSKTFGAQWVMPYNGSNSQKGGGSYAGDTYVGYYDSQTGNQKTMIQFLPSLPGDADVTKVTLTCDGWDFWRVPPGSLQVGWHENRGGSAPNNWGNAHAGQSDHTPGEGKWTINITGWADTVVTRSDFGGITLGPGTSNADKYNGNCMGKGNWSLEVTYKTAS